MKPNYLLLFGILFYLSACTTKETKPEVKEPAVKIEQLLGDWEVKSATRDLHPTESVNGALFNIKENGQLVTNLLGNNAVFNYILNNEELMTTGIQNLNYDIRNVTDSTLELSTKIRDKQFVFLLGRQETKEIN